MSALSESIHSSPEVPPHAPPTPTGNPVRAAKPTKPKSKRARESGQVHRVQNPTVAVRFEERTSQHATVRTFTLGQLVRSSLNVRKRGTDVGELVALIQHHGLLQNLVGYPQVVDETETGLVEIVAGGRRLQSLAILIENGNLHEDYGIAVLLVTKAEAIGISMAENRGRTDMHPADVYTAMQALTTQGRSMEDIALGFNLDVLTVKRCLKLANISPRLLELYRNDEASFDQMMALAITDDHAAQEQAWDGLGAHRRSAYELRRLLMDQQIDVKRDRLVRFVGVDAFEAAGGAVTRDLFSDTGAGFIADAGLLERLANTKLEEQRRKLMEEGYLWVDLLPRANYATLAEYANVRMVPGELCEAQQKKAAKLRLEADQLLTRDAAGEDDWDQIAAGNQIEQLETERLAIERSREQVPMPEDLALAGAYITLDDVGNMVVKRNVIRPSDRARMARLHGDEGQGAKRRTKSVHSERLTHLLSSHRTAALQTVLLDRPDTALVVLTHTLLCKMLRPHRRAGLAVKMGIAVTVLPDELKTSPASLAFAARRESLLSTLPSGDEDWFAWLQLQPKSTVLELMAVCVASSLDTTQVREGSCPEFIELAHAVDLDMAKWWSPTAAAYFNHVSKERVLAVVTEAVSAEAALPLEKMKKGAAAEAAERALSNVRWLPEPLRI